MNPTSVIFGLGLFLFGMATTLIAQTLTDSNQRIEKHRVDLSGAPNMEVIVSVADYQPGEEVTLHSHHGVEAMYVIQGAAILASGNTPSSLKTGATGVNLRDVLHAGFRVTGDTPLKLFTVHVVDKDQPLYEFKQ